MSTPATRKSAKTKMMVMREGYDRTAATSNYSALIATIGCTAAARRADGTPATAATRNAAAAAIE
jgi:hypothetical protein